MRSVVEIAAGVRAGTLSAVDVVVECLRAIDALDARLEAWVYVDREGALDAARRIGAGERWVPRSSPRRQPEEPAVREYPMLGVPVGVKDIFDVGGLPTTYGAGPFAHTLPKLDPFDHSATSRLREAGAIILGKTATTQFAYMDPASTRNPWDTEHTPGGSSSGSAAAVAAGMAPLALGTQTVGSVLRPAAYCGIVGFKPSHGRISTRGVFPLAPSFDHVGLLTRSVEDALVAYRALHSSRDYGYGETLLPPSIGVPRAFYRDVADAAVCAHVDAVAEKLASAGARVKEVELPIDARALRALGEPVLRAEAALAHTQRFGGVVEGHRPHIRALIEAGLTTTAVEYLDALAKLRSLRRWFNSMMEEVSALLLPVAPTTAPLGLESTGDATLCALASFTGFPSIALPSGIDAQGLPLSVHLVGWPDLELHLLGVAGWVERVLDFRARPPLSSD